MRRSDQMHFAYDTGGGVMSPPIARPRTPGVPYVRRSMLQGTTGARLRAAGREEGRMCPHTTAKCANCGGPHGARADACAAKKIAQHAARGWGSPPPPRRERRRAPEEATPDAEAGESGVEGGAEPEVEGMEK